MTKAKFPAWVQTQLLANVALTTAEVGDELKLQLAMQLVELATATEFQTISELSLSHETQDRTERCVFSVVNSMAPEPAGIVICLTSDWEERNSSTYEYEQREEFSILLVLQDRVLEIAFQESSLNTGEVSVFPSTQLKLAQLLQSLAKIFQAEELSQSVVYLAAEQFLELPGIDIDEHLKAAEYRVSRCRNKLKTKI